MRSVYLLLGLVSICGCTALQPPKAADGYGAVVYAPSTRDWRLRWQAADPQRAQQHALGDCSAADCKVVLAFGPGQCATIALGEESVGVGLGDTPAVAETAALADCQRNGQLCRVAPAECNR